MSQEFLVTLSIIILFIPFLGFLLTMFIGMKYKWAYLIENALIVIGFLLSVILLYTKLTAYLEETIVSEFNWINFGVIPLFGEIVVKLGIQLDNVAVIMNFTVFLISMVVHLFSIDYMKGDNRYNRYFAYLGIFTFSMTGIVLTNNVLMMYIFWELVGLSSYLLIGFWFEKKSASDAAKKAFIVNRIGDLGMFAGILMLFITYKTFSFQEIFDSVAAGVLPFNSEFWLTITGLLLFCGAIGKSAQFPLHVWLPDAMEGPTPVSALIHAATMVAAGVYFIVRIFPILSGDALLVVGIIGAISAFIPATIALTQNNIKRVLAYSTVSQLGYMIMALGVGAYVFAFFHLITHAFFKACLFLGSGSVIHALHQEQDIQNMGGLRKKLPITYSTFLLATLALSGIPFTSGFLSKDGILAGTLAFSSLTGNWFFSFIGFTVAALTAFYMFRLVILTFHGQPRNKEKYDHAHESPSLMIMPLIVLSGLSIFIWYTPNPFNADSGWIISKWIKTPQIVTPESSRYFFMIEELKSESIIQPSEKVTFSEQYTQAMHSVHFLTMFLSVLVASLGILFAFLFYQWKKFDPHKLAIKVKTLYNMSLNKWYFDEFYNSVFVGGTIVLSSFLRWIDNKIIDGIVNTSATVTRIISYLSGKFDNGVVDGFVNFTAISSGFIGLLIRKVQTGKVQTYIVLVIFSLLILFYLFKAF